MQAILPAVSPPGVRLLIPLLLAGTPLSAHATKWDPCGIIADLSGFAAHVTQHPTDIEDEVLRPLRQITSGDPSSPAIMPVLKFEYWGNHFRNIGTTAPLPPANQGTLEFYSELIGIQNLSLTLQIIRSIQADYETQILTARSFLSSDNLSRARTSSSLRRYNTVSCHFISKALTQLSLISGTVISQQATAALAWANQYSGPMNQSAIEAFEKTGDLVRLSEVKTNIGILDVRLSPAIEALRRNYWKRVRSLSSPNSLP